MEGARPTLKGLKAAPWLPIIEIEPTHNDPVVIPAGTWVGILGADETGGSYAHNSGSLTSGGTVAEYYLAPASTGAYTLTYSTNDTTLGATWNLGNKVLDLDTNAPIADGAESASDGVLGSVIQGVKPVGIAYTDIYASWLGDRFLNYERQPSIGVLMHGTVIQVPAVTANERGIEPGDMVMVDSDPSWFSATGRVGHLVALRDAFTVGGAPGGGGYTGSVTATDFVRVHEHVVGRCIRKIKVAFPGTASGTAQSAETALSTALSNGAVKEAEVSIEFRPGGRVQTVPGLTLQGSGTKGIPGHLLSAKADSNGVYWALEIAVATY